MKARCYYAVNEVNELKQKTQPHNKIHDRGSRLETCGPCRTNRRGTSLDVKRKVVQMLQYSYSYRARCDAMRRHFGADTAVYTALISDRKYQISHRSDIADQRSHQTFVTGVSFPEAKPRISDETQVRGRHDKTCVTKLWSSASAPALHGRYCHRFCPLSGFTRPG